MIPPIAGLDKIEYLTNETIFDLENLPRSTIILGGGPFAIETAQALNRLGVKITIIHRSGQILKKEDVELVEHLRNILEGEGIIILSNTKVLRLDKEGRRIIVSIENSPDKGQIQAESLLMAAGRVPNIEDMGLENAGVQYDTTGVIVDRYLRTTAKNIYACGDIVPPYLHSHLAEYEAIIAATNACFGLPTKKTNYKNTVWTTFTDPELAHAGMTEEQARSKYGNDLKIYRCYHNKIDRCRTDLVENGISKIICDSKSRILGAQILGHGATEVMHELQLAKSMGKKFSKIASIIHSYPSYSDSIRLAAKNCYIERLKNNIFIKFVQNIKNNRKFQSTVGIGLILFLLLMLLPTKQWLAGILQWSQGLESGLGTLLFVILLYVVCSIFLLPVSVLTLGSGFLFGILLGQIVALVGSLLGASASFYISRKFGRKWIASKIAGNKKYEVIDEAVAKEGYIIVALTRLSTILPFNLVNYAFGLTKIKFLHYVYSSIAGMLPGLITYVFLGACMESLADAGTGDVEKGIIVKILSIFGFIATIVVILYVRYKAKKAIRNSISQD
jgi:uncharacterized membrane protein YdjX (TVP38/TMEM64 family)